MEGFGYIGHFAVAHDGQGQPFLPLKVNTPASIPIAEQEIHHDMASKDIAKKKRATKPKKKRSYRGRAVLWIFVFMVIDEVSPGIPLAEVIVLAILVILPRWLLNIIHRIYEYVPHRQSWRTVGDICHRNVLTIAPQAPVIDAARLMAEEHVQNLVVVERRETVPTEEGKVEGQEPGKRKKRRQSKGSSPSEINSVLYPVGIITDRDIALRVEAEGLSWQETTVTEVMTADIEMVQADSEVHTTVEKVGALGIRQMPVVDQKGNLLGILSLDDIVAMLSDSLGDMVELLRREAQQEAEVRS